MAAVLQLAILLLTMSVCLVSANNKKNFYLFYAPKSFTPENGITVTVILSGEIKSPTTITAELLDGDQRLSQVSVVVPIDEHMGYLNIKVDGLKKKSYTLLGSGKGGVEFNTKMSILCKSEKYPAFVQTDKPMYKPGETVKFRAFSLYNNLTTRTDATNASVYDANKNLLYNFPLTMDKGVYSGEFGISSRPALGTWSIKVTQEAAKKKQKFKVQEYVPPKFEVTTTAEKFLYNFGKSIKDNGTKIIDVYVKAMYTQGKPVSGTANLEVKSYCVRSKTFHQQMKGEAHFKIELDDLDFWHKPCSQLTFNASVKNELNGKVIYAARIITDITDYPISISNEGEVHTMYTPKTMSNFQIFVNRRDNLPLTTEDIQNPLEISVSVNNSVTEPMSVMIPSNGIVIVAFIAPDVYNFKMKVTYRGVHMSEDYKLKQELYFSGFDITDRKIILTKLDQKLHNKAMFKVTAAEPMDKFAYLVVSHSVVMMSKVVLLKSETSSTFVVDLLPSMFPEASVLVNYVQKNGQLFVRSASVDVERPTKELISANYTKSTVKPGDEAELVIRGVPGATVFVGAIDKSVLLLSKSNDIVYKMILKEFQQEIPTTIRWGRINECDEVGLQYSTNMGIKDSITNYYRTADRDELFMMPTSVRRPKPVYRIGVKSHFIPVSARRPESEARVRTAFPETWIWDKVDIESNGENSLVKVAPDTITSWVTTAFAVHPTEGLSVLKDPVQITTYQDFYISLDIPYSIIRGETFKLNVYVFKYISKEETVTVQLKNASTNAVIEAKEIQMSAAKTEMAVSFSMAPKTIGKIPVLVVASCSSGKDAVQRMLRVKPEGRTHFMNSPFLANVTLDNPLKKSVDIKYPLNVVEGSKAVTVSIIGDILGPVLAGIEHFIRLPTGCGEQTMLSLYPNVLVYMYLTGRGRLRQSVKSKIERFITHGYQNELNYLHKDGSFSAFGKRDESGSTWLTAYVMKCFSEAKFRVPGVVIDPKVITKAAEWLIKQQDKAGKFNEPGRILQTDMQGGTSSSVTMTAFVLISILQSEGHKLFNAESSVKAATKYLKAWLHNRMAKDAYSLSIVLNVFALQKDDEYFDMVDKQLRSVATNKGTMMYWPSSSSSSSSKSSSPKGDSRSVATAAYVLLAYSYKRKITEGLLIQDYLLKQRNSFGGFGSTQDTVLGLEALAWFSSLLTMKDDAVINVEIQPTRGSKYTFPTIAPENSMIFYQKEVDPETSSLDFKVTGVGYALAQVSWQFNLNPSSKNADLTIAVNRKLNISESAVFDVCVKYMGNEDTGMVIVSIDILSGYSANLVDSKVHPLIMKSEVQDNKLIVYIDSLAKNKSLCFLVTMDLDVVVENMQPQIAEVAMYYEPETRAAISYMLVAADGRSSIMLTTASLLPIVLATLFQLLM